MLRVFALSVYTKNGRKIAITLYSSAAVNRLKKNCNYKFRPLSQMKQKFKIFRNLSDVGSSNTTDIL